MTKRDFGCPVKATTNAISGKWKISIIWHLSFAPRRFAELRRLLTGVSEKVLTAQLRELERDGIVRRIREETVPPRVEYLLAQAGEALMPVLEAMCGWGTNFLGVLPNLPRGGDKGGLRPRGPEMDGVQSLHR